MKRIAVTAGVLSTLAAPTPAPAHDGCHTRSCNERVHRIKCSQTRPRHCVERAILTYRLTGWQAAWMRRIPACESTWNPLAYFPGQVAETRREQRAVIDRDTSAGLYAFKPSTWRTTRYARRDQFRAKWSALAAAWMVRNHRTGEWECT